MEQKLIDLVQLHLIGELNEKQFTELSQALKENPELRQYYLDQAELDLNLEELSTETSHQETNANHVLKVPNRQWHQLAWAAAALFMLTTIYLTIQLFKNNEQSSSNSFTPTLAFLTSSKQAKWSDHTNAFINTHNIQKGDLELLSGQAEITLRSGAIIKLDGKCKLSFQSRNRARLSYGELIFIDETSEESFDLITPHSTMIDLGTAYKINVTSTTEEVHVMEGEVWRMTNDTSNPSAIITENKARRFGTGLPFDGKEVPIEFFSLDYSGSKILQQENDFYAQENFNYQDGYYQAEQLTQQQEGWASPWALKNFGRNELPPNETPSIQIENSIAKIKGHFFLQRTLDQPVHFSENKNTFYCAKIKFPQKASNNIWMNLRSSYENESEQEFYRIVTLLNQKNGTLMLRAPNSKKNKTNILPNTWYYLIVNLQTRSIGIDRYQAALIQSDQINSSSPPTKWQITYNMVRDHGNLSTLAFHIAKDTEVEIDKIMIASSWMELVAQAK